MPWLIVAPTVYLPGPVPPSNSFLAMSAILQIAGQRETELTDIYCPGLATGEGQVGFEDAAREMAAAHRKWRGGRQP